MKIDTLAALRRKREAGLFAMALSTLMAAPAVMAQQTPQQPAQQSPEQPAAAAAGSKADEPIQEITITGIRNSLRTSMGVKRDSVQVVDSISAEDVGDFPDKNVGEALQRVTGVQISRQDGEGRGVSIRGAEPGLNRVEINGNSALPLTVGGGDRAVDFRDIPVEFISRLDVVKSPSAEMTEGGLGGTVRVITRRPFDSKEPFIAGSAQGIYSDLAGTVDPKVALIGSRTFFNDTLGVLLSGSWEDRNLDSNNARTTGWVRRDPAARSTAGAILYPEGMHSDINHDGTPEWIPEIPRLIIDRRDTKRTAFNSIVEWRPNDDFKLYLDGTYARGHEVVNSSLLQFTGTSGVIDYSKTIIGNDSTINHIELTSTTANPLQLNYRNILGDLTRTQYTTTLGSEWKFGGNYTLDGRLDFSKAKVQNNELNSTATATGFDRAIIDYTGSQRAPEFSFDGLDPTTGQRVTTLAAVFNPRTNDAQEFGQQINLNYEVDDDWLTALKFGFQHRDLSQKSVYYARTTNLSCLPTLPSNSAAATSYRASSCADIEAIVNNNSGNTPRFFKTGDLGYDGGVRSWNDNGMTTYDATIAAAALVGGSGNNDPYTTNTRTGQSYLGFLDNWEVTEETTSGYFQGSYSFPEFWVPVKGTFGARLVDTNTTSAGYNAVVTSGVTTYVPASAEGGYTKLLPSFNARFDFIPNKVIGRFTASEVMARPAASQLALRRTTDSVGLTGSRGNPDLKPFQATQFDLGGEWYFSRDSFFSTALFRKEISSFIDTTSTQEVIDGQTYTISRPVNGDKKVTINGIEAGLQYAFTFLPGPFNNLGALANYTYQKDKGYDAVSRLTGETLPFQGLSRNSYNGSVYYEDGTYSARVSYNWRSKWLIAREGRGQLPEFNEAYGTLDASFGYTPVKDVTFFLEAVNLTDEVRIENNNDVRRIGNETFGRRVFFGIRGRI